MNKILTQGFSTFAPPPREKALRAASVGLLDTLAASHAAVLPASSPGPLDQLLLATAQDEPAQALARLQSSAEGLDAAEAARRLARDGPNEVQHEPLLPGWLRLWRCYLNPFNLAAVGAGRALRPQRRYQGDGGDRCHGRAEHRDPLCPEGRSHRAADGLRALVTNTATVIRHVAGSTPATQSPTKPQEIPVRELVAGDVVALVSRRHDSRRLSLAERSRPSSSPRQP